MSSENVGKRYHIKDNLKGRDRHIPIYDLNTEPEGVNKCYSLPKRDDFYTQNM